MIGQDHHDLCVMVLFSPEDTVFSADTEAPGAHVGIPSLGRISVESRLTEFRFEFVALWDILVA